MKGIFEGLKHIHSLDYMHRDLKPTNVVIDISSDLSSVKIVDFGLAIKLEGKNGLIDNCGTIIY